MSRARWRRAAPKMAEASAAPLDARQRQTSLRLRTIRAAVVLLLLFVVDIVALGVLFDGPLWQMQALAIVACVVLVPAGVSCWATTAKVFPVALGGIAGTAVLAFFSVAEGVTPRDWFGDDSPLRQAAVAIQQHSVPVPPVDTISLALAGVVGLVAWLCAIVVLPGQQPLIGAGLALLFLVVPTMVTARGISPFALVASGILFLVMLWATTRSPSMRGSALAIGAASLVVAMVGSVLIPVTSTRLWNPSSLIGAPLRSGTPDVMVALGNDLVQPIEVSAFTHTESLRTGYVKFKLAELSKFDHGVWKPDDELADPARAVQNDSPMSGSSELQTDRTASTVNIDGLVSSWLPLPSGAMNAVPANASTKWNPNDWRWVTGTTTARSVNGLTTRGDTYVVNSMPLEDGEMLQLYRQFREDGPRQADPATIPAALKPYLELPSDVPASITETASEVAAGAGSTYAVGLALVRYFTLGEFRYNVNAPVSEGTDRSDPYSMIASFLTRKSGYCVHFASSMAVMARTLGIPSRVAVGYSSGTRIDANRLTATYDVTNRNLHAWPELYIAGIGWVGFEPTPGVAESGNAGGSTPTLSATESAAQRPVPTSSASSAAAVPTPSELGPNLPDAQRSTPGSGSLVATGIVTWLWGLLGALAVLAVLPALIRARVRRRRLREVAGGPSPGTAAWLELASTIVDLGLDEGAQHQRALTSVGFVESLLLVPHVKSSRDHDSTTAPGSAMPAPASDEALRARIRSVSDLADIERFAPAATRSAFVGSEDALAGAPDDADDASRAELAAEVAALRAALFELAPPWRRVLARVVPSSLWRAEAVRLHAGL